MSDAAHKWDVEPEPVTHPVQPPLPGWFLRLFDRIFHYQEWRERWH